MSKVKLRKRSRHLRRPIKFANLESAADAVVAWALEKVACEGPVSSRIIAECTADGLVLPPEYEAIAQKRLSPEEARKIVDMALGRTPGKHTGKSGRKTTVSVPRQR